MILCHFRFRLVNVYKNERGDTKAVTTDRIRFTFNFGQGEWTLIRWQDGCEDVSLSLSLSVYGP